ncbi:hypothetical protein CN692_22625 [Bacillus sp. AFS002410]|uniref:DUF3885 domain-containing protein n=1 Tax=Bacillus sp. AFS002410 TaxID=2033481 RepID=UPI000BF0E650|nr:DUF3885 domain-containing protein [Bacillus sp. AFS002410]PEJ51771.1 hypothetical protein CN692_22625 [Bacillus sp. AFS002410]
MNLKDYLSDKFPNVELIPSVYYQWDFGIHFSLGGNIYQFKKHDELNFDRFRLVYKQTSTIFNELFEEDDDLFLVTNLYKHKTKEKRIKKLNVYKRFLKNKNDLNKIQVKSFPYPFEMDDAEEYEMQQFSLKCKRKDFNVHQLLKAACNEDFPPLNPRFGGYSIGYPDVFFVNVTKDIIFFIYDDRGCEVVARNVERLRLLYKKYFDWVEDVDRNRIENGLGLNK